MVSYLFAFYFSLIVVFCILFYFVSFFSEKKGTLLIVSPIEGEEVTVHNIDISLLL